MQTTTSRLTSGTEHEIGIIPDRIAARGFIAVCELHDWHGPTRDTYDQAADDAADHDHTSSATPHYPHHSSGYCEDPTCSPASYDGHQYWDTVTEFAAGHHRDHSICDQPYFGRCDHIDHISTGQLAVTA